jgi:hypothetical protein
VNCSEQYYDAHGILHEIRQVALVSILVVGHGHVLFGVHVVVHVVLLPLELLSLLGQFGVLPLLFDEIFVSVASSK